MYDFKRPPVMQIWKTTQRKVLTAKILLMHLNQNKHACLQNVESPVWKLLIQIRTVFIVPFAIYMQRHQPKKKEGKKGNSIEDMAVKKIVQFETAVKKREGGGFMVRRPVGDKIDMVDPFLMLDHLGPTVYGPGEAIGAPDHPHRGFETVTYIIDGKYILSKRVKFTSAVRLFMFFKSADVTFQ